MGANRLGPYYAKRNRPIVWNAAADAESIDSEAFDGRALEPAESLQLLEAAKSDRLEALYTVALSLGLQRSEALGLRWGKDEGVEHSILRGVQDRSVRQVG